jgi:hypothetical protein
MNTPVQIVKNKPVATVGTTAALVSALIGYAVFRGWIDSGLGALLEPVFLVVAATIMHALVSPYAKVKAVLERGLHITDADYGRLEALVEQYGLQIVQRELPAPAEKAAPAASTAPEPQGGLTA